MRVRLGGSSGHAHTPTRAGPAAGLRLPAAYDLLDVPAGAGHRVLLQLERLGAPLGPVLTVPAAGAGYEGRLEGGGEAWGGAEGSAGAGASARAGAWVGAWVGAWAGARTGAGARAGTRGGGSRLRFFVEAGTTASFLADLKALGWEPEDTDIRTIGVVPATEAQLPAAASPRWVRAPEAPVEAFPGAQPERTVALPPARLLLGALAHACRRAGQRRVARSQ